MGIPKEKIEEIRKRFKKNCTFCAYLTHSSHDYESWYWEPAYCSKSEKEFVSNLKSFPFHKEQKCFEVDTEYFDWNDEDLIELRNKFSSDCNTEEEENKVIIEIDKLRNERYWDLF